MKNIKKQTICIVFLVALISSLIVFPSYASGKDTVEMYSFKTIEGYYLCAEDGGGSTLTADRTEI